MKKKNLTVAALVIGAALAFAFIFAACEMEVAEEEVKKPIITPYISVPPASASYTVGDTVKDLQAQVWDWNPKDGRLSYQWYTFDDIAAYTAGTVEAIGQSVPIDFEQDAEETNAGVKVYTMTLPLNIPEAAGRYYYYLEINNHDSSATGGRDSVVRSGIATISLNSPGNAAFPVITRQPSGNAYQFGRSLVLAELTIRAVSPDSGELSYQWYYGTTVDVDKKELIEGATETAYRPSIDQLSPGTNYFFVEVTNTVDGKTQTELSAPAVIDMEPGETALEPVIIVQPLDKLYFTDDVIQPLTVQAEEPSLDGGIISYQWYSNTTSQARNGRAVSGATDKSFTPPISSNGTYYYYAVVTNTNQSVKSRTKTATANTRAVKIVVTNDGEAPAVNVTVNVLDPRIPLNRYQYIRGYGGMDTAWANFPEQKPSDMETMYNPDWGLGYNMNRIMISPGNTNVNISIRDLINSHRPYYYENVKIVNKYGGYNLASPWSPPKEWKSNNSINGGGKLIYTYRQQFADYLRTFAKHMYDAGAPIYAISISNEPNYTAGYDGCEWTPDEMRDFYKLVNPQPFTRGIRGYGGGRELPRVLTMNGESANTPDINRSAMRDPDALKNIDLFARHVYGEQRVTLWNDPELVRADGTKYEVWMTEHNINSANATAYPNDSTWPYVWRFMNDVDLVMRLNNENAFVWWASKRFYSMVGDGQYGTRDGAALPRGYGLSHYAKYTIDTHRVGIAIDRNDRMADGTRVGILESAQSEINNSTFNLDNLAVRISAYAHIESGSDNKPIRNYNIDTDGFEGIDYISLVMWAPTTTRGASGRNVGTMEIKLPEGFVIGGVSAHKSRSATRMFETEDIQISSGRDSAFVTLGPGEILSVKLTRQ